MSRFAVVMLGVLATAGTTFAENGTPAKAGFLSNPRQVTFEGLRSGEGYFSADGTKLVFQSERVEGNPFYQIFLLDLETGDTEMVSPGAGKTTCSWVHPAEEKVLFASTHHDPEAKAKQEEELEARASGDERRYSWDYDPEYELYAYDLESEEYNRLTNAYGYDAECAYSPDGSKIVFASNRHAYEMELSEEDAERFEIDKSLFMDVYIMDADGSNVQRLTEARGYDGGPFFNADGTMICWRRFSEDGATAEIYTMNTDGSNKRKITDMGVMSWAPFFHPSGDYLIFSTNKHGFGNFELYLVDSQGQIEPIRVTDSEGFDGLPSFSPDGKTLAWTSNRTPREQSQIFFADWNHTRALKLIQESEKASETDSSLQETLEPLVSSVQTHPDYRVEDLKLHAYRLASEEMQGRLTGTEGGRLATAYVAEFFQRFGLEPAGDNGSYYQEYEFTAGISLGEDNALRLTTPDGEVEPAVDEDWRPLAFSATGDHDAAEVVFAGYGIVAPAEGDIGEYDSYVHLDVQDKWVMVFRYLPEDVAPEVRQHLSRHASLRYKAMLARDRGAKGLIIVSGPNSQVKEELAALTFDVSIGGTSVGAVSVTDPLARQILDYADKDLEALQTTLDAGDAVMGFTIPGVTIAASIDLVKETRTGRNVVGRLSTDNPAAPYVMVGAHLDHLGRGHGGSSLAKGDEEAEIHYGADDNASGVAAMLEIAEYYKKNPGNFDDPKRDLVFAAWTGEELGLLGSDHFAKSLAESMGHEQDISQRVAAYLNMDMVGRLEDKLVLSGVGSSSEWRGLIERRNIPVGLPVSATDDSYLPTDATSFYLKKVPILSAFTGAHEDYHTPRDTADKLNYDGTKNVARFMGLVAESLVESENAPDYIATKKPDSEESRAGLRAYLGTIPDYAETDVPGVKLSGVTEGAPADEAGIQGGDTIVELAGRKIENIYDYTYAIQALKIGEEVPVVIRRGDERIEMTITPSSRE